MKNGQQCKRGNETDPFNGTLAMRFHYRTAGLYLSVALTAESTERGLAGTEHPCSTSSSQN